MQGRREEGPDCEGGETNSSLDHHTIVAPTIELQFTLFSAAPMFYNTVFVGMESSNCEKKNEPTVLNCRLRYVSVRCFTGSKSGASSSRVHTDFFTSVETKGRGVCFGKSDMTSTLGFQQF